MKKLFSALMILFLLLTGFALAEEENCYINPDGGKYYHIRPDCETMAPIYQQNMKAVPLSQIGTAVYADLTRCPICYKAEAPSPSYAPGQTTFFHVSPYLTAVPTDIQAEGIYYAGKEITAGMYTAFPDENCTGSIDILAADGSVLRSFHPAKAAGYSFYLENGMAVSLPGQCRLKNLEKNLLFQTAGERSHIPGARYVTMLEIPGREYCVTPISGKTGKVILSSIEAETGHAQSEEYVLQDGEVFTLNLQQRYDVFVEFSNCVVWVDDPGNG